MRIWKFGDNVNTDEIIPGRFLTIYDPQELAAHVFEGTRDEFRKEVREGDLIVAGKNFGCGSSREHAPIALKAAGIRAVIARSFARIFYRNAINTGLLPVICPAADQIEEGMDLEIHADGGYILADGRRLEIGKVPGFLQDIINAGGLVPYGRALEEVETCTRSR
ncbi:MAG: 3-isopropylmalate dehydratase small subunit [Methanoculleaceae archaeon]